MSTTRQSHSSSIATSKKGRGKSVTYKATEDDSQESSLHQGQKLKGAAQRRYEFLSQDREPYLRRARACSKLTIPHLIPPDSLANGQALPTPYQSVGASGVTGLASKLLMSMLPPNEPCFRLRVDNLEFEREQERMDKNFKVSIEKALSRIEQAVIGDIESKGDRPVVYEGNQHLLVGGNVLYHDDKDKGLRLIPLAHYVTDRAPNGQVVEIVVKEKVNIHTLPRPLMLSLLERIEQEKNTQQEESIANSKANLQAKHKEQDEVDVYTHVTLEDDDKWHVYQECKGLTLEGTSGTYKRYECPYIPVRMYHVAGENYGRSYVESYLGDLKSLEALSQAILEATAISAKVVFLVNPNSFTSPTALAEADNGAVLEGNATDVTVLQVQKQADLQVAYQEMQILIERLNTAFLMVEGVRRNAERVTAEEIRIMAQELEAGLGGVYTVVSQEFQLPYITGRMAQLTKQGKLPAMPDGIIRPTIVTGFEALGRGNDKQKLIEFLSTLTTFGEQAMPFIHLSNAMLRLASSMGINPEGLIKTEEEIQQEQAQQTQAAQQQQQQTQLMDMTQSVAPELVRQIGGNLDMSQIQQQMLNNSGGGGMMPGGLPPQMPQNSSEEDEEY